MNKKLFVLLLGSAVTLSSCVSKKKYDDLQSQFETVYQAQQECSTQLTKCNSDNSVLQAKLDQCESTRTEDKSDVKALQNSLDKCLNAQSTGGANITKLIEQIDSSNKYIKQLINSKNKSDSLNMVLTNNLTKSLSRDEMSDIDIQVQKGVVFISLSDNMLYQSGSYKVSPKAEGVLAKIAKIINDYPTYDVIVEGNTDNVPISKTNIRDNWDLSALRASSVVQILQDKYGVEPKRMTAGGRGEYNTIASNSTSSGRAENRRTEIIITPQLEEFMELIGQAPKTE